MAVNSRHWIEDCQWAQSRSEPGFRSTYPSLPPCWHPPGDWQSVGLLPYPHTELPAPQRVERLGEQVRLTSVRLIFIIYNMTPLPKVASIVQRLACIGSHKPIFYDKPAGVKSTQGTVQRTVLMAFMIQSGLLASQITNTCGICTMTYRFEEFNIITRVNCSVQRCIDVPRLSDSQCQTFMTTKQGGVRSVDTDSGSALIRGCVPKTGGGVECGDNPTRCGEIPLGTKGSLGFHTLEWVDQQPGGHW